MNIIAGLGNPGSVYEGTRHNVGFSIVKDLAEVLNCDKFFLKKKLKSEVCKVGDNVFMMPQTFMNGSGFAVKAVCDFYQKQKKSEGFENLYVIHDDLDLPLGEYKIKYGSGPIGHNGLLSAYQHLGTKNFWHVRVGIDTREGDRRISSPVYVLQKFNPVETEKFNTVKIEIITELKNLLAEKN